MNDPLDFEEFHRDNLHVYDQIVAITRDWLVTTGQKNFSIVMAINLIRWNTGVITRGAEFKLNNNHGSFYSRLVEEEEPDLVEVYEQRHSEMADAWIEEVRALKRLGRWDYTTHMRIGPRLVSPPPPRRDEVPEPNPVIEEPEQTAEPKAAEEPPQAETKPSLDLDAVRARLNEAAQARLDAKLKAQLEAHQKDQEPPPTEAT